IAAARAEPASSGPPKQSGPPVPAKQSVPAKPAAPPKTAVTPVDKAEAVAILGRPVTGPAGVQIGRLIDVLVDGTGQPQAAVLDVGGFMGVGSRSIAVHWNTLHFAPWNQGNAIRLDLTLDQIKAVPEYRGLNNQPAPVVAKAPATPMPAH
ncbi:MAG: PRC-barrel domain-containing protein, partial [Pseudomonadota bacterium]|nr:PRC-barrel domain-containing protein [Pseudomonadota bacterium]